jgi:hypothetical protein
MKDPIMTKVAQRVSTGLLLVAVFWFGGCSPKLGGDFVKLDRVPEGRALIYIYRPFGNAGFIYPIDIHANGKLVVSMPHQSYYPYLVGPGEVEFTSRWGLKQVDESVTIHAKPGETYYLKTIIRPVGRTAPAILEVVSLEDGEDEIKECKLILLDERDSAVKKQGM